MRYPYKGGGICEVTKGKCFGSLSRGGTQDVHKAQAGFLFTLNPQRVTCNECISNLTGRMRA